MDLPPSGGGAAPAPFPANHPRPGLPPGASYGYITNVYTAPEWRGQGVGGRVLDGDGWPIEGLYAAGEIIGTYYRTYTGATSVLKGLVFMAAR